MPGSFLSIEKLLRPAWNFELDYDGVSGGTPILFTHPPAVDRPALGVADYSVLDEEARLAAPPAGISPVLAKFVQVPMGASMLVLFPVVTRSAGLLAAKWAYVWRIVWRIRSAADYVKNSDPSKRKAYQIGKTTFGAADSRTTDVPDPRGITSIAGQRTLIPGVSEAVIYGHGEPKPYDIVGAPVSGLLMHDAVSIPTTFKMLTASPLYPGQINYVGNQYVRVMDYQQGIFDPNFPGIANPENPTAAFNPVTVTHLPKWIKCNGTEFAVECYKFEYTEPENFQSYTPRDWDFQMGVDNLPDPNSEDFPFSVMFGIGAEAPEVSLTAPTDTGVRVMVGTAPE